MAKRDYYEILGVSKSATADEIKKSYRRLAMKHHPDRNKDDGGKSEKSFNEAKEAYEVLKDSEKKSTYDQFGHDGLRAGGGGQGGFGGAEGVGDIFGDVFGDIFGGGRGRSHQQQRGGDLKLTLALTLEEIYAGSQKTVKIKRFETCEPCSGSGAEGEAQPSTCSSCQGTGEIRQIQRSFLGQIVNVQPCHHCSGKGTIISNPCKTCRGDGRVKNTVSVDIEVPSGVSRGNYMTMSGDGNRGPNNIASGDLVVYFDEKEHDLFLRDVNDIFLDCWIDYPMAVFGGTVEVPTLSGKVNLKVPAGIKSGQILRLKGKGIPEVNRHRNGDELVKVNIKTPTKYSKSVRKLLEGLRKELDDGATFSKFN